MVQQSLKLDCDLKVLTLALHFYQNIGASGPEYLQKLLSESSMLQIVEFFTSNGGSSGLLNEEMMLLCARIIALFQKYLGFSKDDWPDEESKADEQASQSQKLLRITAITSKKILVNSQVNETCSVVLDTMTLLSESVQSVIPTLATSAVINKVMALLEYSDSTVFADALKCLSNFLVAEDDSIARWAIQAGFFARMTEVLACGTREEKHVALFALSNLTGGRSKENLAEFMQEDYLIERILFFSTKSDKVLKCEATWVLTNAISQADWPMRERLVQMLQEDLVNSLT